MSNDCFEATLRHYFVPGPRVTHKIVIDGKVVGQLWDNGGMTFDEPETESPAQQESAAPVSGPPPT